MSDKIKRRNIVRGIKVIDKAGNAADRMKNAYIRLKDETKQTQHTEQNSPTNYATDNVTNGAENTVYETGNRIKKQSAKIIGKFVKGTAKRTIKTAQKSVKSTGNAAKITIKTSQKAVKTTQTAAKTTKSAAQLARISAKASMQVCKTTIKITIAAVKAFVASIKGLVGLIAAGGWIAIVVILVICMAAFIISSPYAIFGGGGANGTPSMTEVIGTINSKWDNKIEQLKTNAGDVEETVITINSTVVTSARVQNWADVLSVYSVKTSMCDDPADVAELDSNRKSIINYVFNDMNAFTCKTEETTDKDNNPVKKLIIEITSKNYNDMILKYNFNVDQQEMLIELMSEGNKLLWKQIPDE